MQVGKRMKKKVITIRPDDPIRLAMELIYKNRIRQLPVVDAGRGAIDANNRNEQIKEVRLCDDAY